MATLLLCAWLDVFDVLNLPTTAKTTTTFINAIPAHDRHLLETHRLSDVALVQWLRHQKVDTPMDKDNLDWFHVARHLKGLKPGHKPNSVLTYLMKSTEVVPCHALVALLRKIAFVLPKVV